ncbi:TPA: hypothetical protein ACOQZT_000014 [Serratia odorifera]
MREIARLNKIKLNEQSLSKQWLFWLSILIPLIISLMLSIPLWLQTKINLSPEGYDTFLKVFKLPIGVLSLSIPFVAIVAHIHRTIQTAKQIELTNQKNITDRFFSHHKYIVDSFSSIKGNDFKINKTTITPKISHPHALYNKTFPTSSYISGVDISSKKFYVDSLLELFSNVDDLLEEAEMIFLGNELPHQRISKSAMNFGRLWMTINEINRMIEFSTQSITLGEHFKFLAKDVSHEVKLVIPYVNENELKEIIGATIFITNHILEVIGDGKRVSFESNKFIFEYHIKSEINLYDNIFKGLVKSNEGCIFSMGKNILSKDEIDAYEFLPKYKE